MAEPLIQRLRSGGGSGRFVLLAGIAGAIAAIWAFSHWASAPNYVTLFQGLDPKRVGDVSESLRKHDIVNRVGGAGTEIEVAAKDVARARVALAQDGLPATSRPGLELFDKPSWGMTDFTQRVTFQRALEGELSRTIGGLRGIESAEVHLVLPVSSPVRRLERPASASVVVKLEGGYTLTPSAVQGITYIVSNSVEQLSSDNVAVMDDAGRMVSVPSAGTPTGALTRQLEIQRALEQQLALKVEELIGTVVGPGRSQAEVAAFMSFDQVDRTVESYDPDGQVIQNEQRSEGGEQNSTQAPTVFNNTYQNSRSVEKSTGAVGKVTRLMVAVLVDEKALPGRAGSPERGARLAMLEQAARTAVGADSARGDRVEIAAAPFDGAKPVDVTDASPAAGKPDPIVMVERYGRPAVNVIAVLALVAVALAAFRGTPGATRGPAATNAPSTDDAPVTPLGMRDVGQLQDRLRSDLDGRPEDTARVLRAWLVDS